MTKLMNEDAPRRMIRTASGLKPMPTPVELDRWARESARKVLREAGKVGTDAEINELLNSDPPFEIPSWNDLIK